MTSIASEVWSAIFFGLLSFFVLSFARKKGLFSFEEQQGRWAISHSWYHVVIAFGIYFVTAMVIVPLYATFFRKLFSKGQLTDFLAFSSWLNFLASLTIFFLLVLYFFSLWPKISAPILRRTERGSFLEDARMALLLWLASFPLILFVSHLFDLLVYFFFHEQELPEQLAVHFLKMTFDHPLYFFLAGATIVLFAPMIEETLFRGFLQSFLRKHLGSKQAIALTSVCFAFFHYSPEQGLGNIPIITSLFTFALFLGFVYEKRGSLRAPIVLHATFNGVSILNLYFLGKLLP